MPGPGESIPIDIEKSEIATALDNYILQAFIMGMYTIIYFGTIYVYASKSSSKHYIVPATVTLLYLSYAATMGAQWYAAKWQFINNGDTRASVFLSLYNLPRLINIAGDLPQYIALVLGDALLIWRCFFVWNRSIHIVLLPLFLLLAESGLLLNQIGLRVKYDPATISLALILKFNQLLSAAFFVTFVTTLITTLLIAYRIFSVSKREGVSIGRFKHIIDIVIQSGVVNSLTSLTIALTSVIGSNTESALHTGLFAVQTYTITLLPLIGISTTIMVARVALMADDITFPSTSVHLSGLQFHARSTRQTTTQVPDAVQPSDTNISSLHERQDEGEIVDSEKTKDKIETV